MVNHLIYPSLWSGFEAARLNFSDNVIGPVLPRRDTQDPLLNPPVKHTNPLKTSQCELGTTSEQTVATSGQRSGKRWGNRARSTHSDEATNSFLRKLLAEKRRALVATYPQCRGRRVLASNAKMLKLLLASGLCTKEEMAVLVARKEEDRREQLREAQARYRKRVRDHEQNTQRSVLHLREEIRMLAIKIENIQRHDTRALSTWNIVGEVFQLIDTCFQSPKCLTSVDEMKKNVDIRRRLRCLETALDPSVALGELHGFDALLDQLRFYALYFGEPTLALNQMKVIAPGVMGATATLSVSISALTLKFLFPHLEKQDSSSDTFELGLLRSRLVGQRLSFSCTLKFLFNEDSQLLERIEVSIDLFGPLARILGSVEAASIVCKGALISSECTVGNLAERFCL